MQRLVEILLGLDRGFLSREGEFTVQFHPYWPGQEAVGAGVWNVVLAILAVLLVVYVYRRDGHAREGGVGRIALAGLRLGLLGFLLAMLNRPSVTLEQRFSEPSVLAVMVDDSLSMRVADVALGATTRPVSRLEAVVGVLEDGLLAELGKKHQVKVYRFSGDAQGIGTEPSPQPSSVERGRNAVSRSLSELRPTGQQTSLAGSIQTVLNELQGQRLAGVVLLTDGRNAPLKSQSEIRGMLKDSDVPIYAVPMGSATPPPNIEIQQVSLEDVTFLGDLVSVRVMVRKVGTDKPVTLTLKDKKTQQPLRSATGQPVQKNLQLANDTPTEVELSFKPAVVGTLDLVIEAEAQPGEVDAEDNVRSAQVTVLDARIVVLYVDGYPRWEYRYLKNQLLRDKTITVSCLLTSADPTFAQEGNKPITQFPLTMEQLLEYDVLLLGDVDPRQFTDRQLQMVSDFVGKMAGGLGMISGEQFSPRAWRNTPIEAVLPVTIGRMEGMAVAGGAAQGFRPVLSSEGLASSIFRFYPDKAQNEQFLKDGWQPLFWYARGVAVKPGVGVTLAEHPVDSGADGHKSPILVLGRFGAGRTLFSAIDDSWRWRFYTGESVFDTYWVQQLRYLARGRKLGQRQAALASDRPVYEMGQQVRLELRVLDGKLLTQLPSQIRVEVEDAGGQVVRQEILNRGQVQADRFSGSFAADHAGRFIARAASLVPGAQPMQIPFEVIVPRLELASPVVDRTMLSWLAKLNAPTDENRLVELDQAKKKLPGMIPSAAIIRPVATHQPLWDAPLVLMLFVVLITAEWIGRKMKGML